MKLAPPLFAALLTTGVALGAGCSSPPTDEPTTTLDEALSAEDYDTAVRHLASLPYLPWAYTTDGCYARALYYSMLLVTKGVPTNHVYVVARPGTQLGGQWRWHVAPLVSKAGESNRLYVLDPVYDRTRALTNVEWVAKQNHTDPSASNYPQLHVHNGASYLQQSAVQRPLVNPGSPDAATYAEPALADMPSFEMRNVSAACDVMHRYLDREPGVSATERAEKHLSLGRETQRIVGKLAAQGKIVGDPASLSSRCTRNEPVDGGPDPSEPFVDPSRIPVDLPE